VCSSANVVDRVSDSDMQHGDEAGAEAVKQRAVNLCLSVYSTMRFLIQQPPDRVRRAYGRTRGDTVVIVIAELE
jgi:hypothetical protein